MYTLDEEIALDKNKKHDIEVVIDRLVMKETLGHRLTDSVETALRLSDGFVTIAVEDGEELPFSEKFACNVCGISYPEISPRLFSFNNPHGACPQCGGLGTTMYLDPDLIVPNRSLSLREGAIVPWEKKNSVYHFQMLDALVNHYNFDIYTPFEKLPPRSRTSSSSARGKKRSISISSATAASSSIPVPSRGSSRTSTAATTRPIPRRSARRSPAS